MIFFRIKSWLTSLLTGDSPREDQPKDRYSILERTRGMRRSPTGSGVSDDGQASSSDSYCSLPSHDDSPFNCMCSPLRHTPLTVSAQSRSAGSRSSRSRRRKSKKSGKCGTTAVNDLNENWGNFRVVVVHPNSESSNNTDSEQERAWIVVTSKNRHKAKNLNGSSAKDLEKPTNSVTNPKSSSSMVPGLEFPNRIDSTSIPPVSPNSLKAPLSRRESFSTGSSTESFSTTFSRTEYFSTTFPNTERSSTAFYSASSPLTVLPNRSSSSTTFSREGNSTAFSNIESPTTYPKMESFSTDSCNMESPVALPDTESSKFKVTNTNSSCAKARTPESFDSEGSNKEGSWTKVVYCKNHKTANERPKAQNLKSSNTTEPGTKIPSSATFSKDSKYTGQKRSSTPSINHKRSTNPKYSRDTKAYVPRSGGCSRNTAHSGYTATNPSGMRVTVHSSRSGTGNLTSSGVENSDSVLTSGVTIHQRNQENLSSPFTGHGKAQYSEVLKKSFSNTRPANLGPPNFQKTNSTDSGTAGTKEISPGNIDSLPHSLEYSSPSVGKNYSKAFGGDPGSSWNSTRNGNSSTSVNAPVRGILSLSRASSGTLAAASTAAVDSSVSSNCGKGWDEFLSEDSIWDNRIPTPPAMDSSSDLELLVPEDSSTKVRISPIGGQRRNRLVRSADNGLLPEHPSDSVWKPEPENLNLSFSSLPSLKISLFKHPSADDWHRITPRTSSSLQNTSDSFSTKRYNGMSTVSRSSSSSAFINELQETSSSHRERLKKGQFPVQDNKKKDCIDPQGRISTNRDPRWQVVNADPYGHVTPHEDHQGQVSAYAPSQGQASVWGDLQVQVSEDEHSQGKGSECEDAPNQDYSCRDPVSSEIQSSKDMFLDSQLPTEECSKCSEEKIPLSESSEITNTRFDSQECGSPASDLQDLCYSTSDHKIPNDMNTDPQGQEVAFREQSRESAYDDPQGGAFDDSQGGGTAFDGPQGGGAAFDGPQGGETAFDGPQGGGTAFDGPQGGGTAFDGPQGGGTAYDENQGGGTAYEDPRRQIMYSYPQGQVSSYGDPQRQIVYADPQGQVSAYGDPRQQIVYGYPQGQVPAYADLQHQTVYADPQEHVSAYENPQVQVSVYAHPQGHGFACRYPQGQDSASENATNQNHSCPVLQDSQYLYAVFQPPNCIGPGLIESHNMCTNSWSNYNHLIPPIPENSSQEHTIVDSRATHASPLLATDQQLGSQTLPNQYGTTEYTFQQSTTMNSSSVENQVTQIEHSISTVTQSSPYIAITQPLESLSIAGTSPYENLSIPEQSAHSTEDRNNANHSASEQYIPNNPIHGEHISIQPSFGQLSGPIQGACEQPLDSIHSPYGQPPGIIQSPNEQPPGPIQSYYEQQPGPIQSPYGQPTGLNQSSHGQLLNSFQSHYEQSHSPSRPPYVQQPGLDQAYPFRYPGSHSPSRPPYVQQPGLDQAHPFRYPGSHQSPYRQPSPNPSSYRQPNSNHTIGNRPT